MSNSFSDFTSIETNATTADSSSQFDVTYIDLISNDGTDDISFNFMGTDTNSLKTFTLKSGEFMIDIYIPCKALHWRAKSGSQPFRAWGFK